ncbi:MAG: FHA domain-containing protein [Planctomycetales bacterium]|nr:FHA domain-containing protein [Planctomycetales bacterium]
MQPIYILAPISAGTSEIQVPADRYVNVGREANNEFSFPHDLQMSSVHFTIGTEPGGCRIRDLGSSNGLFLNTKRVSTAIVVEGDEVQAGGSRWQLVVRPVELESNMPTAAAARDLSPIEMPPKVPPPTTPSAWTADNRSEPGGFASVLLLTADDNSSRRLVGSQRITIGRTTASQWVFDHDEQMSSCHMELSQQFGVWKVTDLDSSNGTFVNGSRVSEVQLFSGDEIRGGQTRFKVALSESTPEQPTPRPAGITDSASVRPPVAEFDEMSARSLRTPVGDHAARRTDGSCNDQISHASLRRLSDGREFDLAPNQLVSLGRSLESQISVANDFEVSTQHATILFDGNCLQLRDLGSSNGTFVGGKRVTTAELDHGDRLRVGKTEFVVCLPPTAGKRLSPAMRPLQEKPSAAMAAELPYYSNNSDAEDRSQALAGDVELLGAGHALPTDSPPPTDDIIYAGADSGTAESGTVESGTAESGTVESGTAESGTVESDTDENGTVEVGSVDGDANESGAAVPCTDEALIGPDSERSPNEPDARPSVSTDANAPEPQAQVREHRSPRAPSQIVSASRPVDLDNKDLYAAQAAELKAIACPSGLFVYLGDAATLQPVDVCLSLLRAKSGWVLNGSEIENWIEAASQGLGGSPREWLNPSPADDASWMLPFLGNWGTGSSWLVLSHAELEDGLLSLRDLRQPGDGRQPLLASLNPTALADFLIGQDSSQVEPFFAPFDAILVEVGSGERWALVGRLELQSILQSSDL